MDRRRESPDPLFSPPRCKKQKMSKTMEADGATSTRAKDEVMLVFSGKTGAGKSTLISNILRINMDALASAELPVSERGSKPGTDVSKVYTLERNGTTLKVVDTVGLIPGQDMSKEIQDLATYATADLLVYCLPVSPGSKFVDGNPAMMKALQDGFGKDIWKHCLLVFTFSNMQWSEILSDAEDDVDTAEATYLEYVREYAAGFKSELKTLGVTDVNVCTIFDKPVHKKDHPVIVTIPAGKRCEDNILPGINMDEEGKWMEVILREAIESCKDELKAAFRTFVTGWSWKDYVKAAVSTIFEAGKAAMEAVGPKTAAAAGAILVAAIAKNRQTSDLN